MAVPSTKLAFQHQALRLPVQPPLTLPLTHAVKVGLPRGEAREQRVVEDGALRQQSKGKGVLVYFRPRERATPGHCLTAQALQSSTTS